LGYLPNLTFSKDKRLLKASEFQEVFDTNTFKIAHPKLLMLAKFNDREKSRLGLVVGKKNIPSAVDRNYVKRIVRETFRLECFIQPIDVVFLARKDAHKLSSEHMTLLLQQSWCRLRQRCGKKEKNNA